MLTASNFVDSTQRRPTASPSTSRRPPRKPKQSGHALWVGNLPPSANVEDLKDHFSRDTTNGIESVFLISRSNCAFVNYKTETACNAAMTRFHDSRFQGVRLVCRLRRGLMAGSGSNVAAMSMIQPSSRTEEEGKSPVMEDDAAYDSARPGDDAQNRMPSPSSRVPERFFIVKSLTVEDLELSRQSGIWATQTHNEANLNKAYEVSDGLLCH
jgi:RNA recognition motif-containing protein